MSITLETNDKGELDYQSFCDRIDSDRKKGIIYADTFKAESKVLLEYLLGGFNHAGLKLLAEVENITPVELLEKLIQKEYNRVFPS